MWWAVPALQETILSFWKCSVNWTGKVGISYGGSSAVHAHQLALIYLLTAAQQ